jgi:hypothetical protein
VARHRSPRGRAHRIGAHRSSTLPIPLRGAAVAAVTGGALSLVATMVPTLPADDATAALRLSAEVPSGGDSHYDSDGGDEIRIERRPSVVPVRYSDDRDSDDDSDGDSDGDSDRDSDGDSGGDSDDDSDDDLEALRRADDRAAEAKRRADEARAKAEAERKARAAAENARAAAEKARKGCAGLKTSGLGAVKAHVREAGAVLGCRFGKPTMFGVAGRGGPSDHPGGLAIDFMVNRATGDGLAQCALDNMAALGVKYVIWEQQINHGNGWKPMADRGGVTANHFDHVHVSFERGAGGGGLKGC